MKKAAEVSNYNSSESNRLKLTIDDRERKYFREIFDLNVIKSEDGSVMSSGKINQEGLLQIF